MAAEGEGLRGWWKPLRFHIYLTAVAVLVWFIFTHTFDRYGLIKTPQSKNSRKACSHTASAFCLAPAPELSPDQAHCSWQHTSLGKLLSLQCLKCAVLKCNWSWVSQVSGQKMKKVMILSYLEKSYCISHKLLCSNEFTFKWLNSSFPQILWDTAAFRIYWESFYSTSKNTSPKLQQLRSKLASPFPCEDLISLLYLYNSQHSLKKNEVLFNESDSYCCGSDKYIFTGVE